jgi:hypothetical protein
MRDRGIDGVYIDLANDLCVYIDLAIDIWVYIRLSIGLCVNIGLRGYGTA